MPPPSRLHAALRLLFWCAALALTIASLVPVALLPPQAMNVWDKAQHALGFGALALLGLLAYPRAATAVLAGLLLWGGVIEMAQSFTGWRYGDWIDWLADAVGIALAWAVWRALTLSRLAQA